MDAKLAQLLSVSIYKPFRQQNTMPFNIVTKECTINTVLWDEKAEIEESVEHAVANINSPAVFILISAQMRFKIMQIRLNMR